MLFRCLSPPLTYHHFYTHLLPSLYTPTTLYHLYTHLPPSLKKLNRLPTHLPLFLQLPNTICTPHYYLRCIHLPPSLHPPTTISTPIYHISTPIYHHLYTHLLPSLNPPTTIPTPTYHHLYSLLPYSTPTYSSSNYRLKLILLSDTSPRTRGFHRWIGG